MGFRAPSIAWEGRLAELSAALSAKAPYLLDDVIYDAVYR